MSRHQLYRQAKLLAQELGIDEAILRGQWRRSNTEYWRTRVKQYKRNIRNRNKNFNRALKLSRELIQPLRYPPIQAGTTNEQWVREVNRLRSLGRRGTQFRPILQELKTAVDKRNLKLRIDKHIRLNEFQQVLNIVINENETLSNAQANQLYANIIRQGRYILTIGFDEFTPSKTITINNLTRDFITSILSQGIIARRIPNWGSDVMDSIDIAQIMSLTIQPIIPKRIIFNRDGRFFPYINTTDLMLGEDYQIFNQEEAYDKNITSKREQCLLYSLLKCGISQAIVNEIKMSYIKGVNIRKTDLKKIANLISRDIVIHSIDGPRIAKRLFKSTTKDEDSDPIELAIHSNHYFVFKETKYSKFSIDNYADVKDEEDFHKIVKKRNIKGKIYYNKAENRKINSLLLVDKLYKSGFFKKLDLVNFEEASSHKELKDHVYLDNIDKEQQKCKDGDVEKKESETLSKIYYADCESYVSDDVEFHQLQLLGVCEDTNDNVTIFNVCDPVYEKNQNNEVSKEQLLVYDFLKLITGNGRHNALCYFHNLKYDYMGLLEPYLNIKDRCEKDGQVYNVICIYKGKEIELRDSYKIVPIALNKFGKEFNLPKEIRKKEAISYEYYTRENNEQRIKTRKYRDLLSSKNKVIFGEAVRQCSSYDPIEKTFNPMTYYKEYLRLDCIVLKKGIQKFNTLIGEITENKMDVYECLTISSLTDKYMIKKGAYKGVYEIKGNLRSYVAQAVYGGRVCCNNTKDAQGNFKYKKKLLEGKFSDYDGCSLYPSAINRLCRLKGLPLGKAKRFEKLEFNTWKDKHYSVMTVKINKVNKIQQMPFIAYKNEKIGSISYTNTPPPEAVIIDSITLEDYIKFHDIEYQILDGVYWNEGGNKKMGEIIRRLYDARLGFKKTNKALANAIKLMLNSAFGKTIMKKTTTEKKIVKTENKSYDKKTKKWIKSNKTDFESYVYNNFNTIKNYRKINGSSYEIEKIKSDNSFNRGHIGCAILSTSKRIMNEVFDIANDNKLPIYYTDTDSLHMNYDDVSTLEDKYRERYGRDLNGKQLEQFHTDFSMTDENGNSRQGKDEEIYATKSIFLGKKSYLDVLESKDDQGNIIKGYHIRLKGITKEGLEHTAKEYINKDDPEGYLGLYNFLLGVDKKGKPNKKQIILNPINKDKNEKKVLFEFKDGRVKTRKEFIRIVSF